MQQPKPHAHTRPAESPTSKPAKGRSAGARDPQALLPAARQSQTPASHPVRVLCVDDHAVLVEGLAARFALEDGLELAGRLATAAHLLEECERLRPHVVILDIEMPGPDAFEMADRLKHQRSDVRVMVLSAHIRDAFISAAFRAGASAYFSKADDLADIVAGIFEVAKSRRSELLLGPKVRERCRPVMSRGKPVAPVLQPGTETGGRTPATLLSSLTSREAEILRFIGKGMSRTQIARELCRSVKTVDAHQARMMKKLAIAARSDLMRFAIREGFAEA
jgi:DNA-binding NarL/FixJ family response regulator